MTNRNTIPAFSLIEVVVGMAITAIIMGVIFVIFSIITERMLDYKNQNQLINDVNRFTFSLNKDIFENEKMNVIDDEVQFIGYSGENVIYNFEEDYVLRNAETFTDTFRIKLKNVAIDSVKSKTHKLVFRKLRLNVEVNKKEMDLRFYKQVYTNELLEIIKE